MRWLALARKNSYQVTDIAWKEPAMKLLTLVEAAERTNLPVSTFRHWRYAGGGPPTFRVGRRVMVAEADLDAWIAAQYATAGRGGPHAT